MDLVKEVKMLETMAKHYIISDQCAFKLIEKLSSGGDDTNFVINLIYKIWNRKFTFIKKYEKVIESEIQNIYENYTKDLRAKQINKNFVKTESYCLMNKFTPENVGELLNKIKNAETYSEILRCCKYTDRIFMFDLFKIKDNNDDYIDIETNTSINSISLMFYNKCKCKITREHYEDNLRSVLIAIHYRMERIGGYRLNTNTHRFFNETINRTRMSREAIEV